jgi:AcrR family transcriptional regulator
MHAGRTARERAREELTREIKEEARRQLGSAGADGLSLRAVARELGMVSSALYRYFPSRDDLLTALIIDAYDAVGAAAEEAAARTPDDDYRRRWAGACHAVREWALARPYEYALIYGSPVPGYRAPDATIGPASRVPLLLVGIVREAWLAGSVPENQAPAREAPARRALGREAPGGDVLAEQLNSLAAAIAPGLPPAVLQRTAVAWTQLFGMISFELFGQFARTIEPADEFFARAVTQMMDFVGL